jgi:hypothetical protein
VPCQYAWCPIRPNSPHCSSSLPPIPIPVIGQTGRPVHVVQPSLGIVLEGMSLALVRDVASASGQIILESIPGQSVAEATP